MKFDVEFTDHNVDRVDITYGYNLFQVIIFLLICMGYRIILGTSK